MTPEQFGADAQLTIPGMPAQSRARAARRRGGLRPGARVVYRGNLQGGPRFGARGVVREIRGKRVVVDLNEWGIWHIPFYFLSGPLRAA